MAMTKHRQAGSEGRPWCDKHPPNVLLCWCGYVRADCALNIERSELVPFEAPPQPGTMFQQALKEGANGGA